MVQRLAGPERATAQHISAETGVSQPTLSRWLRDARKVGEMPVEKKNKGAKGAKWSGEDMLRIVTKASQLDDVELGAFLREEGLHEATLAQWREVAAAGLANASKPTVRKASPEAKKLKALEKELRRKDKALAELSALIVLRPRRRSTAWPGVGWRTRAGSIRRPWTGIAKAAWIFCRS